VSRPLAFQADRRAAKDGDEDAGHAAQIKVHANRIPAQRIMTV
jgi:hypothetical protein